MCNCMPYFNFQCAFCKIQCVFLQICTLSAALLQHHSLEIPWTAFAPLSFVNSKKCNNEPFEGIPPFIFPRFNSQFMKLISQFGSIGSNYPNQPKLLVLSTKLESLQLNLFSTYFKPHN